MRRSFYFSFIALALTIATAFAFVIGRGITASAELSNSAAAALPASDFVVIVDVQRALNEVLPTVLSSNPAALAKVTASLEKFQAETGINPRVFESVAIGGTLRPNARVGRDPGAVVIASGSFKSDELLNAAFTAARKDHEFEKTDVQYEGKTIVVVRSIRRLNRGVEKKAVAVVQSDAGTAPPETTSARATVSVLQARPDAQLGASDSHRVDMAVTALGPNMIAVGSLESVRASIDASLGRNRVDDELVKLALQNTNTVVGFSGRVPVNTNGTDANNLGNPIASYFASVRAFYGSFAINGSDAESSVSVRLETSEQATEISQAINSIKGLASFGIGQSMGPNGMNGEAFAAILKGTTITSTGNELHIDLKIPHTSLKSLIRMHH